MKIWLDDVRDPGAGWLWVKDVPTLKRIVQKKNQSIEIISLDHDLGENIPTGYDFLNWFEGKVAEGSIRTVPKLQIHSANPVGRKNMEAAIKSIERLDRVMNK